MIASGVYRHLCSFSLAAAGVYTQVQTVRVWGWAHSHNEHGKVCMRHFSVNYNQRPVVSNPTHRMHACMHACMRLICMRRVLFFGGLPVSFFLLKER